MRRKLSALLAAFVALLCSASAKAEAAKLTPVAASLGIYGMTYQEWAAALGAAYAAGLLLDLVVRRWLVPLVRHLIARRRPPVCEPPA